VLKNEAIITFRVYVTACDLKKSFIFDVAEKITGNVPFPIRV